MAFKRYVAIVGSSGGGGATQSGSDVYGLLVALKRELAQCEVGLAMVQVRFGVVLVCEAGREEEMSATSN
jgi:hypothetical protein